MRKKDIQITRQHLTALVSANYPEVRKLKIKHGQHFVIRARYKRRYVYVKAYTLRHAVIYFFEDLNRKIFLEKYPEA